MTEVPDTTMFFVIGASKAGTTWLHHFLSRHPQVSTGPFKEYSYFNYFHAGDRRRWMPRSIAMWLARASLLRRSGATGTVPASLWMAVTDPPDYKALVRGSDPRVLAFGDISPEYSVLGRSAFTEMASLHERVRFIFVMRDPVDRIWSQIRMYARKKRGGTTPAKNYRAKAFSKAVLERSNYPRVLDALNTTVPADDCLFLSYETMFDPSQISRITQFLGIEYVDAPLNERVHVGQDEACPPDLAAELRHRLSPVYERLRQTFGVELPSTWMINPDTCAAAPEVK